MNRNGSLMVTIRQVRFGAVLAEKESLKKTLISIAQSAESLFCGKVGEVNDRLATMPVLRWRCEIERAGI